MYSNDIKFNIRAIRIVILAKKSGSNTDALEPQ